MSTAVGAWVPSKATQNTEDKKHYLVLWNQENFLYLLQFYWHMLKSTVLKQARM